MTDEPDDNASYHDSYADEEDDPVEPTSSTQVDPGAAGNGPISSNPTGDDVGGDRTQPSSSDNYRWFYHEVDRLVNSGAGHIRDPSALWDFGGEGDCGPNSLIALLNYNGIHIDGEDQVEGIRYESTGSSRLRRIIVERARTQPELLARIEPSMPIELRGRFLEQVLIARNSQTYLDHLVWQGTWFDEAAWVLAAETLHVRIHIHRVSNVSSFHYSYAFSDAPMYLVSF